jgi:phospholipase C
LTSAFDFANPNEDTFPTLPRATNSAAVITSVTQRSPPLPPQTLETLFHERGMRQSRALPYELHVRAHAEPDASKLTLTFRNTGKSGAVFHVYDRLHLERIPRRYTVEAAKALADEWLLHTDEGRYDLWVCGPNVFVREFRGALAGSQRRRPEAELKYDVANLAVEVIATNAGPGEAKLLVRANAYRSDGPWALRVARGRRVTHQWSLIASQHWYDFTVSGEHFERRFAGRLETGSHSVSDPSV